MRSVLVPLLLGGSLAAAYPAAAAPADRVVAVVNGEVILDSTIASRTLPQLAALDTVTDAKERARRAAQIRAAAIDELVNEELAVQAGEQANVEVDDREVRAAIVEVERQNNVDDARLVQLLAQQGFSLDEYKTELRRQLLRIRTVNAVVAPKVTITDADVAARYAELQQRSQNGLRPLAEMKTQIADELHHRELDRQTRLWLDALRKDAVIELTPP
jgi:peptidyl-prolyl cis-trans isomerase SurA